MKEKRSVTYTILLLSSVYFVSYLTRNSYNVVIAQLVRETGLGQSTLALSATGSLVAYGAGQLLSGCFGDRLQPKGLLIMGLGVTSVMNLLMAFCRQPALMLGIWCVNGLAQAFLWPPLVRLMSELFSGELYEKVVVAVTWGGSVGNIALYLAAPALISLLGVESVFVTAALCALIAAGLLVKKCPLISGGVRSTAPRQGKRSGRPLRCPWYGPSCWPSCSRACSGTASPPGCRCTSTPPITWAAALPFCWGRRCLFWGSCPSRRRLFCTEDAFMIP